MIDSIHLLPGRLRLRLSALRRNPSLARRLGTGLAAVAGVTGVQANPLTGSLLVRFDPTVTPIERLSAVLAVEGLPMPWRPAPHLAHRLGEAAAGLLIETVVRRSAAALWTALI